MRILIVTQYYYPEQFQINEIVPELVKRGHEVTVLCGVPNYPKGVVFPGYETAESLELREREYLEKTGVKVVHVEQVPRGKNPVQLVRNYVSFVRNSKKLVADSLKLRVESEAGKSQSSKLYTINCDYDLVLGYQLSPITSMYAALEYKKLTGCLLYTSPSPRDCS